MTKTTLAAPDSAALEATAAELFAIWGGEKAVEQKHLEAIAAARARAAVFDDEIQSAAAAGESARLAALNEQHRRDREFLSTADRVAKGLSQRSTIAGTRWSTAWTAAAEAIRHEMLDGLAEKRAALDAREAAARQACQDRIARMPC